MYSAAPNGRAGLFQQEHGVIPVRGDVASGDIEDVEAQLVGRETDVTSTSALGMHCASCADEGVNCRWTLSAWNRSLFGASRRCCRDHCRPT